MLKRRIHLFIWLLTFLIVLPFILNAQYAVPVLDDYAYAIRDMKSSWIVSIVETYNELSGRYFATLLSRLNPLEYQLPFFVYSIYSLTLIVGLFLSAWLAVHSCFKRVIDSSSQWSLAGLFMVLYLSLCSSVAEGFYWFSSYTAYTVPCILVFLFIALFNNEKIWAVLLKCLLAVYIIGSNEVTAVLFVSVMLFATFVYRKKLSKGHWTVVICVLLAFSLVVFAPGNGARMNDRLTDSPLLWTAIVSPLETVAWFILLLPVFFLFSIAYIYIIGTRISRMKVFDISPTLFTVFFFFSVLLAHIPCTYGLGTVVIGRTGNALLLFLLIEMFFLINVLMHRYADRVEKWQSHCSFRKISLGVILLFFLFIIFFPGGNISNSYKDLISGESRLYKEECINRITAIENKMGSSIVYSPLQYRPKTLYIGDLDVDKNARHNIFFSEYYKLNSVSLTEEATPEDNAFNRLKESIKQLR